MAQLLVSGLIAGKVSRKGSCRGENKILLLRMSPNPKFSRVCFRSGTLDAAPSLYCLMTLRRRCVQLISKPSALSPTLRWPSLMRFTSIWENLRPSSSVLQVRLKGSEFWLRQRGHLFIAVFWFCYFECQWDYSETTWQMKLGGSEAQCLSSRKNHWSS